jgi:hypothetical protein
MRQHMAPTKLESWGGHSGAPTNIRPEARQIICCTVGRIETLTHSRLLMSNTAIFVHVSHTATIYGNELC